MNTFRSKLTINILSIIVLLVLALDLLGTISANAASFVVVNTDDTGAGSLRQTILDANSTVGVADTITFSVSGTITLGSSLPAIDDDLTIDGTGQAITIDGDSTYKIMVVNSGKTVTLDTLTISNGYTAVSGGAIENNGTLNVTNSTFTSHDASYGGAIYNNLGTLTITNSIFSANTSVYGGAIWNDGGTLTVTDSTFSTNIAGSPLGGGGAIANSSSGTVTVLNSTFSNNQAYEGTGSGTGGGISNTSGTLTVTNSTFSGNTVDLGKGGGIYNGGTLNVTNSTFSGNQATNVGADGGGIYTTGSATLRNTIISGSTAGDCSGTFTADSYNMDSDGTCASATQKTIVEIALGGLANNGGLTETMALGASSSAIDAGDDSVCAATVGDPTYGAGSLDQRGMGRPSGAQCDIGSYEYGASFATGTPTKTTTSTTTATRTKTATATRTKTATATVTSTAPTTSTSTSTRTPTPTTTSAPTFTQTSTATSSASPTSTPTVVLLTTIFNSVANEDGWVLESGENTDIGGSINASANTLRIGDDGGDRQYRSILSFNTSALPNNAIVKRIIIGLKLNNITGADPFGTHSGLLVDIRNGFFGNGLGLEKNDFDASPSFASLTPFSLLNTQPTASVVVSSGWYKTTLLSGLSAINKVGTTQLRLQFALDDNDDTSADFISFFSGNYASFKPTLTVIYILP